MRGHIDRKLTGQKVGLECKTANIRIAKSFGESGTDDVPMHYLLQCIGYLALTGWEKWHLAVLIGGNDFRNYTIERDEKAIALVIEQIKQFWDCVEQRQPPPPLNSNDLRLLYPDSTGATIVATTDIAQAVQELKHLTSQEKQITGLKKAQQQLIQGFMEDAGTLSNPDGTIAATWRSSTSNRIDTKSLKEAHPNMAAEFTKQSTSRRFLVK